MILFVSGRTDILAFYSKWFVNRYREGYVDVRNPFNPKLISRINFKNVDLLYFCSKNPIPFLKYLKDMKHPMLFNVTITPYKKDIEPNVPSKEKIIYAVKEISKYVGKENIAIRYDPIFISDKYTLEYHIKAFNRLCFLLNGYVSTIIISFIDEYKNVKNNKKTLNYRELTNEEYEAIGQNFSSIAAKNNMTIQTCFEDFDFVEYGFIKNDCLSASLAFKLTGKKYPRWKARKDNKCNCVQMVDIGAYNTCKHFCKYCYANFDEKKVEDNFSRHNPKSSLLIGELSTDDIIKERIK